MRTVKVTHSYDVAAERLWALATDYDALIAIAENMVRFDGLPKGRLEEGQEVKTRVSLFGLLPWQPYVIRVLTSDDANMTMISDENGAGVETWRHTLTVTGDDTSSQLTDEIQIEAGWMTPLVAMWAAIMYRKRHKPRLRLLADGTF